MPPSYNVTMSHSDDDVSYKHENLHNFKVNFKSISVYSHLTKKTTLKREKCILHSFA